MGQIWFNCAKICSVNTYFWHVYDYHSEDHALFFVWLVLMGAYIGISLCVQGGNRLIFWSASYMGAGTCIVLVCCCIACKHGRVVMCDGPTACSVQWLKCLGELCEQNVSLCTFPLKVFPLLVHTCNHSSCHGTINEIQTRCRLRNTYAVF